MSKRKGGRDSFFSFRQHREHREEGDWEKKPLPFLKTLFFSLSWKRKLAYNEATINTQTAGGWGLPFPKS
jgi:hypothetical protein